VFVGSLLNLPTIKRMKYLGIDLTKEVQDVYTKTTQHH